jgi:hypothetical protein
MHVLCPPGEMPAGPFPAGVSILRRKCELSFHRLISLPVPGSRTFDLWSPGSASPVVDPVRIAQYPPQWCRIGGPSRPWRKVPCGFPGFDRKKMSYVARQTANRNAIRISKTMDDLRPTDDVTDPRGSAFKELDDVVLAAPVRVATAGRDLPAGAHGTIVGVWRNGAAYEVEFTRPFACLVTLRATSLRA